MHQAQIWRCQAAKTVCNLLELFYRYLQNNKYKKRFLTQDWQKESCLKTWYFALEVAFISCAKIMVSALHLDTILERWKNLFEIESKSEFKSLEGRRFPPANRAAPLYFPWEIPWAPPSGFPSSCHNMDKIWTMAMKKLDEITHKAQLSYIRHQFTNIAFLGRGKSL